MENIYYPFVNLPLPYAYDALEPFIDEKTMYLHHDKHLQTYIDRLNEVLKKEPQLQRMSLEQLIKVSGRLPEHLRAPVCHNAGGVYNHRFFFDGLTNPAEKEPQGRLLAMINRQWGGFEQFKSAFQKAALSVFGSGYAWLVLNKTGLKIITTPNQNSPVANGFCPILTIDVWEHAYYLKHYNVRADYISDFMNVIDWQKAEQRIPACPPASSPSQRLGRR